MNSTFFYLKANFEGEQVVSSVLENSTKMSVEQIYLEYSRDFNELNFPTVFAWLKEFNQLLNKKGLAYGKAAHPLALSPHPIFQTPVTNNPKLMIVGNNNSWFHTDKRALAQQNRDELSGKLPTVNSYMDHQTSFGLSLRKIFGPAKGGFRGLGRLGILRECVGINRLWIQIGPGNKPEGLARGMDSVSKDRSPTLGVSFSDYCESRTRKLINLISPELLVLVGEPARRLYSLNEEPQGMKVVYVRHPARGGERKAAEQIGEHF